MRTYPIEIHGIFIAPEHRVFGKKGEELDGHDLVSLSTAKLITDSGIEGDRFCRPRPGYNGHVTFFSLEVWESVVQTLDLPESIGPERARRNIIVSGVDLKALYGAPFSIGEIQFLGTVHCAPCIAMNTAIGEKGRQALLGRGGLRGQIKSGGHLGIGRCELLTEVALDPRNAATPAHSPAIP